MSSPKLISLPTLQKVARRFSVLSEPVRLQLIQELLRGERCVNRLVEKIGCSQANVSRHLNLLYSEGVLARRKEGVVVFYSIADPSVADLCKIVCRRLDA